MTLAFLSKTERGRGWASALACLAALASADAQMALPTPRATPSSLLPPPLPTPGSLLLRMATPAARLLPSASGTPRSLLLPPRATLAPADGQPPRDVPLVEKKLNELSGQDLSPDGKAALGIAPEKWRHAETDNFILHYRRVTEAQKVAREVEYDLWFVATALGARKEQYARKSHVYIFEDQDEWKTFVGLMNAPAWMVSFAQGDNLFLNVRKAGNGRFDSNTLAHETTHAVVARLYGRQHWPVWLNEGFAEYMGGASVAARKGQSLKRHQASLSQADLPLDALEKMTAYPTDEVAVAQLYQTSEKLLRFLMGELPKDRITKFIDATLAGKPLPKAVLEVYGDQVKDWDDFTRKYERFSK